MKINKSKTKVMLFNTARTVDVLPEVKFDEESEIEVVDELKLLGVMLRTDMKWQSNTNNIVSKCYSRMWMLRNLKKHGANEQQMFETYIQQIRSISEMSCPVWNGALTQIEVITLERVEKTALAIIRGVNHTSYGDALQHFNISPLKERREALCLKFAIKVFKNPKFSKWFPKNMNPINTRRHKRALVPIRTRTTRYGKSPLPYLNELLNTQLMKTDIATNSEMLEFTGQSL